MKLVKDSRMDEARKLCRQICEQQPGDAEAWYLLGSIHGQMGEFEQAEACCQKAVAIEPAHAGLQYNLAMARLKLGKLDTAVTAFQKAVRLDPRFAQAYQDMGSAYQLLGDSEKAVICYENALRLRPELVAAHYNLAHVLREQGCWEEAVARYEQVIRLQPEFEPAYGEIAGILINNFMYDKAVDILLPATKVIPDSVDVHFLLGVAFQERGDVDNALVAYRRVIELSPDHMDAHAGVAGILGLKGKYEEACSMLLPLIANPDVSYSALITFGHLARHFNRVDEAIHLLQRHLEDDMDDNTRAKIYFALASLYDCRNEYDRAFDCFRAGNENRHARYDPDYYDKGILALETIYSSSFMQQVPRAGNRAEVPIFIVGMPRSGTSLVEQILASHPLVFGAGELNSINSMVASLPEVLGAGLPYPYCMEKMNSASVNTLADSYLEEIRVLSGNSPRVTDKMPDNFWHLGLIDILFPKARIIHCTRSPLDTCLSCYFHYFGGSHCYAYDLSNLGDYYRKYQRIMQHWKKVLRIPVLDVDYESLVMDQEGVTRKLLEFCDLPWDPLCLEFYETLRTVATASSSQVRKPVYSTSVGRWKHYEKYLFPLKAALADRPDNN
jgi:tetratricopeptide (TPR) repeat protein